MIRVGITGGIGSGKTTFCKEWEKLGAFVVYADDVAKDLMENNDRLKKAIQRVFGEASYDEDGKLDRAYLAQEAFQKGRVEELNELVHPVLWESMDDLARKKEREGCQVFAYEAAILLNNGRPQNLDLVVLLQADEENRIKYTMQRDDTAEAKVRERMAHQPDFEELNHLVDFKVRNDGTKDELLEKAQNLYKKILNWSD